MLKLWQLIEGRRYLPSFRQLAEELEVTTRTVRRDVALLEELYFRVPPQLPRHYFSAMGGEAYRNATAVRR